MKSNEFVKMKNYIINATKEELTELSYSGFLWINLTERQVNILAHILVDKGYPVGLGHIGTTKGKKVVFYEHFELAL